MPSCRCSPSPSSPSWPPSRCPRTSVLCHVIRSKFSTPWDACRRCHECRCPIRVSEDCCFMLHNKLCFLTPWKLVIAITNVVFLLQVFGKDRIVFWRESASGALLTICCFQHVFLYRLILTLQPKDLAMIPSSFLFRFKTYEGSQNLTNTASLSRAAHVGVLLRARGPAPDRHRGAAGGLHVRLLHAHAARDPLHAQLLWHALFSDILPHEACFTNHLFGGCAAGHVMMTLLKTHILLGLSRFMIKWKDFAI